MDDQNKLLDDLAQMAADEGEFVYSIIRGHLDADEARAIFEAVKIAIDRLKERKGQA
jgi:hypothetical protein